MRTSGDSGAEQPWRAGPPFGAALSHLSNREDPQPEQRTRKIQRAADVLLHALTVYAAGTYRRPAMKRVESAPGPISNGIRQHQKNIEKSYTYR